MQNSEIRVRHETDSLHLLMLAMLLVFSLLDLRSQPPLSVGRGTFLTSNLNTDQGLSSSRSYSVIEGEDGAIWISTKQGIDRYNGLSIKSYRLPLQHPYSDASGIFSVTADGRNRLAYANSLGNLKTNYVYSLLTAKGTKDFMIEGLQKGADDYIAKPFDTEILETKIAAILANLDNNEMSRIWTSLYPTAVKNIVDAIEHATASLTSRLWPASIASIRCQSLPISMAIALTVRLAMASSRVLPTLSMILRKIFTTISSINLIVP